MNDLIKIRGLVEEETLVHDGNDLKEHVQKSTKRIASYFTYKIKAEEEDLTPDERNIKQTRTTCVAFVATKDIDEGSELLTHCCTRYDWNHD